MENTDKKHSSNNNNKAKQNKKKNWNDFKVKIRLAKYLYITNSLTILYNPSSEPASREKQYSKKLHLQTQHQGFISQSVQLNVNQLAFF